MFTQLGARTQSDAGFSVEILGRVGLRYREGERSLKVDSEIQGPPVGMLIVESSIRRWDPPFARDQIDELKRREIVENIRAAFRFQGLEIVVARTRF